MKKCDKDCIPCCDFCRHVARKWIDVGNGKMVRGGPLGCTLHTDEEHQELAEGCGFCDDFHCFNVVESD